MSIITEREILAQPSWILASDCVEMAVTQLGAHMAPLSFYRNTSQPVQPYYISPWQEELTTLEPGRSEIPLRGDFFCMPFGADPNPDTQEKHPPHGETSGQLWSFSDAMTEGRVRTLTVRLETKARPGHVTRAYSLKEGENVIYGSTKICGFRGPVTFAHHAILRSPEQERSMLISTSPVQFGMVCPHQFGDPSAGEYQALEPGAHFSSLAEVPSIFKHLGAQDCSSYPARRGFSDLLQFATVAETTTPAWIAVVNTVENYLWFALKDVCVLPSTILWMENHGRYGSPWNGRNCALGLEDACTWFDRGIPESSSDNAFVRRGIRTHHELRGHMFEVRYIQGVVKSPAGFGRVSNVMFGRGSVTFVNAAGAWITAIVQSDFLRGATLQS